MEKLGISVGYLIVQILNFGILFLVLYAWVYKPILGMLEKRRQTVSQGLEDAKVASDARANAEQEAQRIITDAQVKAAQIIREATTRAESAGAEMRTSVEAEIAKVRASSVTQIETERNLMLSGLRNQVVTPLVMAAARRLIGESLLLDQSRQHALVSEFFSGVKDGKIVMMPETGAFGKDAEVTSALPLTAEEQDAICRSLYTSAGSSIDVNFRVDPAILGGLVVRTGDRVVDASVAGQLEDLKHELQ